LRELSRCLIEYTHNSIHLITPFDSGGSSAQIRRAFRMLSVGDLRNRLMALADHSFHGQPEIFQLFAFRFPQDGSQLELRRWLDWMIDGRDPMVAAIPEPMRSIARQHLRFFAQRMPARFDLRGANLGNLILAGGYLNQDRNIEAVIFIFSRLVEVRGVVRPVATGNLHLAAELEDGRVIVGQHLLTGKEVAPISSPVARLFLTRRQRDPVPAKLKAPASVLKLVAEASLICFPMGSFFSSLIANLLPDGIGAAVAAADAPKVYIPNTFHDPEQLGLSLAERVRRIIGALRDSGAGTAPTERLLRYVLVDAVGAKLRRSSLRAVERLGVEVIDLPLISTQSTPRIDAERLAQVLVSMM